MLKKLLGRDRISKVKADLPVAQNDASGNSSSDVKASHIVRAGNDHEDDSSSVESSSTDSTESSSTDDGIRPAKQNIPDLRYKPLQENQIRLLRLFPVKRPVSKDLPVAKGALVGEFILVTLSKDGLATDEQGKQWPFEALSYTWGPTEPPKKLYVDACKLVITPNLHAALRRLRRKDDRVLWIDAVCIDQQNSIEKGHQVPLMGSIYRSATEVPLWIGGETRDSRKGFEALQTLLEEDVSTASKKAEMEKYDMVKFMSKRSWNALFTPFLRDYWSRVWILQEVFLSKKFRLYCGPQELDSTALEKVLFFLQLLKNHDEDGTFSEKLKFSKPAITVLDHGILSDRKGSNQNIYPSLLDGLISTRPSQSTLGADKVYAILGICEGCEDFPKPNYRQSLLEVYQASVEFLLKAQKSLDVLAACKLREHEPLRPFHRREKDLNIERNDDRENIILRLRVRPQDNNIEPLEMLKTLDESSLDLGPEGNRPLKDAPLNMASLPPNTRVAYYPKAKSSNSIALSWPQKDIDSLRQILDTCPKLQEQVDRALYPWPSWIPDWSQYAAHHLTFPDMPTNDVSANWYAAAGTAACKAELDHSNLTLTVQGYIIDTVGSDIVQKEGDEKSTILQKLSKKLRSDDDSYREKLTWRYFQTLSTRHQAYGSQQRFAQAILRATIMGRDPKGDAVDDAYVERWACFLAGEMLPKEICTLAYPNVTAMLARVKKNRGKFTPELESLLDEYEILGVYTDGLDMFLTEKGYVGRTELFRPGDLACVLLGGKVPFLLREYKNTGTYYIVGQCYVEGFMSGEILADPSRELRDFVLI